MDGPHGRNHPILGAKLVSLLLGHDCGQLVRFHSRALAALEGQSPSRLCAPDKLAFTYYPWPLYRFLARLSGELAEYKLRMGFQGSCDEEWMKHTETLALGWVAQHLDISLSELHSRCVWQRRIRNAWSGKRQSTWRIETMHTS